MASDSGTKRVKCLTGLNRIQEQRTKGQRRQGLEESKKIYLKASKKVWGSSWSQRLPPIILLKISRAIEAPAYRDHDFYRIYGLARQSLGTVQKHLLNHWFNPRPKNFVYTCHGDAVSERVFWGDREVKYKTNRLIEMRMWE